MIAGHRTGDRGDKRARAQPQPSVGHARYGDGDQFAPSTRGRVRPGGGVYRGGCEGSVQGDAECGGGKLKFG
jgi:hypothetical protein